MNSKIYIRGKVIPTLDECRKVFNESYDFIESVDKITPEGDYAVVDVTYKDDTPVERLQAASVIDFAKLSYNLKSCKPEELYRQYIDALTSLIKGKILYEVPNAPIYNITFSYTKATKEITDAIYNFMIAVTDTTGVSIERLNDTEIVIKPLIQNG